MTGSISESKALSDVLDATRHEERRRALRALLMRPILILGSDGLRGDHSRRGSRRDRTMKSKSVYASEESFVLVRRHQAYLSQWFARYTGWTLILRSGSARLVKRTVDLDDATRGAIDPAASGGALSRSRYVMWCLALSVLHAAGRQTTLQRLADGVLRAADGIPELAESGCSFDLKTAVTRRSLVCVVRMLLREGLLSRVEGDESKFGDSDSVDCLYDIDAGLLVDVLYLPRAIPKSGSLPELLTSMLPAEWLDVDELRPRVIEHRLIGRLLDNPVLYFDELSEREYQYWQLQRQRLLQVIEDATGLVAEIRLEGVALLDPEGTLTDVKMPDAATIGHSTLLIGEFLAEKYRGNAKNTPSKQGFPETQALPPGAKGTDADRLAHPLIVPIETLLAHLATLVKQHQTHWRQGLSDVGQRRELLQTVLMRLEMLRLIDRDPSLDGVRVLPAICRFGIDETQRATKGKKR